MPNPLTQHRQHSLQQALHFRPPALQDLAAADELVNRPAGLINATKMAASAAMPGEGGSTWGEAGRTLGHDGRVDAKHLVASAHDKYERASAAIGGGLPVIEMAEIKPSKMKEMGHMVGGATVRQGLRGEASPSGRSNGKNRAEGGVQSLWAEEW